MGAHDAWGAASSIQFELPVSGQDYYAWVTEMATSMNVPFRHHYSTQKAEDGTGFWLIEEMHRCGQGRGALLWVGVAPGSAEGLTEFTLDSCNDGVSVTTLRNLAQVSIDNLWAGEDSEGPCVPVAEGAVSPMPAGDAGDLLAVIPSAADRDFVRRYNADEHWEPLGRDFGLDSARAVGNKASVLRSIFGVNVVRYRRNQGNDDWREEGEE